MSDDENNDGMNFDVNKYFGLSSNTFNTNSRYDDEEDDPDDSDEYDKNSGIGEDLLPPVPKNLNDHYIQTFGGAKLLVDYMLTFDDRCSGEVEHVLRELSSSVKKYLDLQDKQNELLKREIRQEQEKSRREGNEFDDFLFDTPFEGELPQVIAPPETLEFPVTTIPNDEAQTLEKSHPKNAITNSSVGCRNDSAVKIEQQILSTKPEPFCFEIRQFNKKKRTKLCHIYRDDSKKNSYLINYERQFRICCFLSEQTNSEMGNEVGNATMVLTNDMGEETKLKLTKKSQKLPSGLITNYLETLHKIGRGGANFCISIHIGDRIVVQSSRFFITGLCDAQHRKKVVEYERNRYTKMCYEWELKKNEQTFRYGIFPKHSYMGWAGLGIDTYYFYLPLNFKF